MIRLLIAYIREAYVKVASLCRFLFQSIIFELIFKKRVLGRNNIWLDVDLKVTFSTLYLVSIYMQVRSNISQAIYQAGNNLFSFASNKLYRTLKQTKVRSCLTKSKSE